MEILLILYCNRKPFINVGYQTYHGQLNCRCIDNIGFGSVGDHVGVYAWEYHRTDTNNTVQIARCNEIVDDTDCVEHGHRDGDAQVLFDGAHQTHDVQNQGQRNDHYQNDHSWKLNIINLIHINCE